MVRRQALRGRAHVEAVVRECAFKQARDLRSLHRWRVDEKETVPSLVGKSAQEVWLRDQKFTLKNAVLERCDQTQTDRVAAGGVDYQVIAQLLVEHISDRVRVGDGRYRTVIQWPLEQQPWILFFAGRVGERVLERKPARCEKATPWCEDTGVTWLVEVEATGIIAGPDPKKVEADVSEPGSVEVQGLPARSGVGIVNHRKQRLRHQREAAGAGFRIHRRALVPPESIHGDDQERRRGDQRHTKGAAARPPCGVAEAERGDSAERRTAAPAEPCSPFKQRRHQQQRASAEEGASGANPARGDQ